jgi:hypothetical protein
MHHASSLITGLIRHSQNVGEHVEGALVKQDAIALQTYDQFQFINQLQFLLTNNAVRSLTSNIVTIYPSATVLPLRITVVNSE